MLVKYKLCVILASLPSQPKPVGFASSPEGGANASGRRSAADLQGLYLEQQPALPLGELAAKQTERASQFTENHQCNVRLTE